MIWPRRGRERERREGRILVRVHFSLSSHCMGYCALLSGGVIGPRLIYSKVFHSFFLFFILSTPKQLLMPLLQLVCKGREPIDCYTWAPFNKVIASFLPSNYSSSSSSFFSRLSSLLFLLQVNRKYSSAINKIIISSSIHNLSCCMCLPMMMMRRRR